MQHDVFEILGNVLEPGKRRFLARGACRGNDDGRDERERVDRALEVFLLAILGADDDDEPDIPNCIERLCRPGENGLAGDFDKLLAALLAETLARAAGQDDGRGFRILVNLALKARHRLRQGIEVERRGQVGRIEHR